MRALFIFVEYSIGGRTIRLHFFFRGNSQDQTVDPYAVAERNLFENKLAEFM